MTSTARSFNLYQSYDDATLAARALQDVEAFTELYHRFFPRVYRFALARTGVAADAQDLTSQTFIAAWEGLPGYRGSGSFLAWLFGIARRKSAALFRSRKPETSLDAVLELVDPEPLPETVAGRKLDLMAISQGLQVIADDRAEAILLCIICDLTAAESGQVMGRSEAAVKMLLMRGLRDLRELLVEKDLS